MEPQGGHGVSLGEGTVVVRPVQEAHVEAAQSGELFHVLPVARQPPLELHHPLKIQSEHGHVQ